MDWLKELLATVDGADALLDKITSGIGKNFVAKSDFNAKNDELKTAKALVTELQGKVESIGADEKKYAELKAQYDNDTTTLKNQLSQVKNDFTLDSELGKSGAKNLKALKALLDMSKVSFGEDGTVEGLKDQIDGLKKSETWLFNVQKTREGKEPPIGDGGEPETNLGAQIAKEQQSVASKNATPLAKLFGTNT